ncbi:MAG: glycosyltransferase family 9 protein [Marivibrio sp.]|uniref:glycosyltransferase family 9 protein n=1 Tax=Marivibrio sp. TaxID=2039719 RepID=UPI0032EED76F
MAILFITSTHIGDAILSTGVLDHLHKRYPNDGVTIACGAPAAKVLRAAPNLEALHVVRKQKNHRHWWELWKKIAGKRWRVVVDLRRSAMPWVLWAGARYTIPKDRAGLHRVALNAATLGSPPLDPVVWTEPADALEADRALAGARRPIALAPGANWRGKIWPTENFADLARRLRAADGLAAGADLALIGAEGEREAGRAVFEQGGGGRIVDGFGLDVLATFELLKRCSLMVGNDSAMMHLAAAAGIPTIGLFGPTKDDQYGPWGPNGFVVRTPESVSELVDWDGYDTTTTDTMMGNLTVDSVLERIRDLAERRVFVP